MTDLSKRLRDVDGSTLYCDGEEVLALLDEAADALDQLEWRPIAEAPRDVPLLVFWPDFAQFGFSIQITGIPADINFNEGSGDVRVPTHFMPIPSPPEDE